MTDVQEKTVEVLTAPKSIDVYMFQTENGNWISTKFGPVVAPSRAAAHIVLDSLLEQYGNISIRMVRMVEASG